MFPILLTMISMHSLKNDMLSRSLHKQGQIPCHEFSTFSDFIQSNVSVNLSVMENLQSSNHLIINGHGDLSVDAAGPVIGSDDHIFTVLEFYNELAPILRKLPHINKIDLLACNLGIEYNQKPSFARELADHLAKEFPQIRVRTFIPHSTDTQLLAFVTESDEVLQHFRNKPKPSDMLPQGYFEIAEYTMSQAKEREEIISKGIEDNKKFEKIVNKSIRLLYEVNHSNYANNTSRQESAREEIQKIYIALNEFKENLDDHEKSMIKSYLVPQVFPMSELISNNQAQKLCSDIRLVQHAIKLRERRWDQSHGFIKCSLPISHMEQFLHVINPEIEFTEDKNDSLKFETPKALAKPKNDPVISSSELADNITTSLFDKFTLSLRSNFSYDGLFGKRKSKTAPKSNDVIADQKKDKKTFLK